VPSIWNELMGTETKIYEGKFRTRVIEAGDGMPLILVHGVGGHAEAYTRNILRLANEGFRVMSIDLLWHGLSGTPEFDPETYCLRFSDQVVDLLDLIGAEKGHIEGESLGGWVAMSTALRYPSRVGKIIVNTTAGVRWNEQSEVRVDNVGGRDALIERSLAAIRDPNKETVRKRLEWLMASPDRVTDELVDLRMALYAIPSLNKALEGVFINGLGIGKDRNQYLTEDQLASIEHPTLVFWSDKNPGSGPDVGERIAGLIPGSEYYCMMDAAHWPQWEHPEEHDRVVADFLNKSA
jgi:pimeloyl-ACP methyl ester carboxylesterase